MSGTRTVFKKKDYKNVNKFLNDAKDQIQEANVISGYKLENKSNYYGKTPLLSNYKCSDLQTLINSYNEIYNRVLEIRKNLEEKIQDCIKELNDEKDRVNSFDNTKLKNNIISNLKSGNAKAATTAYKKLKKKLGKKKAKKWLQQQIKSINKSTGAKITFKKGVISIVKKKTPTTPTTPTKNPPGSDTTGAKVVRTKSGKNALSTKKSKTTTAVASAATIVSYERTMKEKSTTIDNIKKGTANKIEQSRLNYTKNVSQINSDRDAKIANIEADRDNKISDLYSDASDKINNIDANDSNATEQINTIKKELEDNINNTNEEANAAIAKAKEEAVQKIADAKSGYEQEVSNINKASSDEIENITENGLASETNTGKDFAKAANDQPTVVEVDDSALQSANDNKTDAASSLSDNQSNYANDLSQKEQEITNISNTPPAADNNESEAAAPSVDNSTQQNNSQPSNNTSENVVTNSSNSNETYTQSSSEPDYSNYNDNTVETSDSGIEESDVVETPAVPDDTEEETMIPSNPNDEVEESDVDSTASEIIEPTKTKKGPNVAIPIGLGVAAAGAATVAGIRYAKNRKQNEDVDETYDDEDNNVDDYESGSDDSEYMKDDYLGPAGSMYTETDLPEDSEQSDIPDDTIYNNTDHLEEELDDDDDTFPDDEVLNGLG